MKKIIIVLLLCCTCTLLVSNVNAGDMSIGTVKFSDNMDGLSEKIVFDESSPYITNLEISIRSKVKIAGYEYHFVSFEEYDHIIFNDKSYPTYSLMFTLATPIKENKFKSEVHNNGNPNGIGYSRGESNQSANYHFLELLRNIH